MAISERGSCLLGNLTSNLLLTKAKLKLMDGTWTVFVWAKRSLGTMTVFLQNFDNVCSMEFGPIISPSLCS